ncbi:protein prenylyltransferase [Clavulina sp. PMI_390]|nr:protein prenylyltransferase [Clavulina sp. PMI_390]
MVSLPTTKSESPLLYSELDEWKDITPIPQEEEGFAPLAPILYGDEYKDATNYFRAIVKKGEHSKRVLDLTEHIIRLNPSHYSVWQYRYDTLLAIKADLEQELRLMDEIATKFLKTYQVWHHRRLLLSAVRNPGPELAFIQKGLEEDSKNYHTWAYRQWILSEFNEDELWREEIPYVDDLLHQDIRNNSVWHHRFFVLWDSGVHPGQEDREELLANELRFVKYKISLAPNNPSAWNYLRGILEHSETPFSTIETFVIPYTKSQQEASNVEDLDNPAPSPKAELPCVQAVEFLADIRIESISPDTDSVQSNLKEAEALYSILAEELDPMRKKYYEYLQREAVIRVFAGTA